MAFAPLFFLRGRNPTRTTNKHNNPALLHDSLNRTFALKFHLRNKSFYNTQSYPRHDPQRHGEQTLYHPPAHYHLYSEEYFTVLSGSGTWHLWDKSVRLSKGDIITIPTRKWHWFEGDASTEEPLAIDVFYEESQAAMEERFFRNTLGYLADCHEQGVSPSVFQMMVFFMHNEMAPGLRTPGPEWFNFAVNVVFVFVFGGIGEFLMGYRVSYPEYYDGDAKTA